MTKKELKKIIKETLSEMSTEQPEPEGLSGATVFRIMQKGGKVYIQLYNDNTHQTFDAVLI